MIFEEGLRVETIPCVTFCQPSNPKKPIDAYKQIIIFPGGVKKEILSW